MTSFLRRTELEYKILNSKLQFRFKNGLEGHAVETLVIALFNFEGTGKVT